MAWELERVLSRYPSSRELSHTTNLVKPMVTNRLMPVESRGDEIRQGRSQHIEGISNIQGQWRERVINVG